MKYKQSKTPYLAVLAALTLLVGIERINPSSQEISVEITSSNNSFEEMGNHDIQLASTLKNQNNEEIKHHPYTHFD